MLWLRSGATKIDQVTSGMATGINDLDQVVGGIGSAGGGGAFLWDSLHGLQGVKLPGPAQDAWASAINSKSQIAGYYTTLSGVTDGFLTLDGVSQDLPK